MRAFPLKQPAIWQKQRVPCYKNNQWTGEKLQRYWGFRSNQHLNFHLGELWLWQMGPLETEGFFFNVVLITKFMSFDKIVYLYMIKIPKRLVIQGNYLSIMWLPRWYSDKESDCQCKRCNRQSFHPWVWSRYLGEGNSNSLQYSCLENSMDRGVYPSPVVGYSPWGRKESDTAVRQTHIHIQLSLIEVIEKTHTHRKQHIQLCVFPSRWETGQKCLPIALQHRSGRKILS